MNENISKNISKNKVSDIVSFITNDREFIENIDQVEIYNFFSIYFDNFYKEKKEKYYQNLSIYGRRINNNLPEWMIARLIYIDKYDSMSKFGNKNINNFLKKKAIINFC